MLALATGKTETGEKDHGCKTGQRPRKNSLAFKALFAAVYFARYDNAVRPLVTDGDLAAVILNLRSKAISSCVRENIIVEVRTALAY